MEFVALECQEREAVIVLILFGKSFTIGSIMVRAIKKIKRNKLNDLNGSQWLFFTNSIWETNYRPDPTHKLRKVHGAVKPPEAMAELVRFFSRRGERILDPFAGVGGILLGAELEGRRSVGVELEKKWTSVFDEIKENYVLVNGVFIRKELALDGGGGEIGAEMVADCCLNYMASQEPESFHAIITDPPYGVQHKQVFSKETNFAMSSENKQNFGELDTFEEYFEMIRKKTAVLLGCALEMGAMVAGAKSSDQKEIYDFGIHLGLAFQLQDDYLDTFGSSNFGKRIGGDILEAKKTFLYIKGMELCNDEQGVKLLNLFENPVEKERIEGVKAIWKELGTDQLLLKEIRAYTQQALAGIDRLNIGEEGKNELRELANNLMSRNK